MGKFKTKKILGKKATTENKTKKTIIQFNNVFIIYN